MTQYLLALAQQTPAAQQSPGSALGGMIVPMLLIFGVMYLLVIRPQSRRAKEHQKMLSEIKKGDEVVTTGGIIGRVSGIADDIITLQVQEGVRFRVLRSAVQARHKPGEPTKTDSKAS